MAIRFPSIDARSDFILDHERGEEQPTVFVLRRLTAAQFATWAAMSPYTPREWAQIGAIRKRADDEERTLTDEEKERLQALQEITPERIEKQSAQHHYAIRCGLVEIRDPGQVGRKMSAEELLAVCTNLDWLRQLAEAIVEFSSLNETDRKNLSAPPTPGQ